MDRRPATRLPGESEVAQRRTPPPALPACFVEELEQYLAWLADPRDGSERVYQPSTIKQRRTELRLAARALAEAQGDPGGVTSLGALVVPAHTRLILEAYLSRTGHGAATAFIRTLTATVLALARYWIKVPPEALAQLTTLQRKLGTSPTGLTSKTRQVLRELADPQTRAALLALPAALAASARRPRLSGIRRRQLLRTAVAIELLLHTGMRLHQLTSLRLGQDLTWPEGLPGPLRIRAPGRETRDGAAQEYELVGAPQMLVEEYLERFGSKVSRREPHPPLFTNADGTPVTDDALADGVEKATLRGIGIRITPRQLRHFCATLLLDVFPDDYGSVKDVTGHRFVESTLALYGGRQRQAVGLQWNARLARKREQRTAQKVSHG